MYMYSPAIGYRFRIFDTLTAAIWTILIERISRDSEKACVMGRGTEAFVMRRSIYTVCSLLYSHG